MTKFPIFQGKKKKRKREKLQESASGRPWPPLTCHLPQVYSRNQGLRYLIFTSFYLTLASDGHFKIFHLECKLVNMHTTCASFPLHLSEQQSWRHQHLWLNLHIAAITVLFYLCFSPQCCIIFRLNYVSNTVGYFWMLETLHRPFVVTVFFLTVFYVSLYTNSCLVGWLKASVRSSLCL